MENIVSQAGFLMSYALDTLRNEQILHPFYESIFMDCKKSIREFREGSFEQSIPKAIDAYRENILGAKYGIVVYPAEIEKQGKRAPLIVAMLKDYENQKHITIAQYYTKKGQKPEATQYEVLDASDFLADRLPALEKYYLQGALSYSAKVAADAIAHGACQSS